MAGQDQAGLVAAVVGGVGVLRVRHPGRGVAGRVLIDVLDQSLVRVPQVSEFWRNAILGALILAGVVADVAIGRFRRRWSAEARPHTRVDDAPAEPAAELEASDAWSGTRVRTWELLLAAILVGTIVYNARSPVYLDVDNFVNLFRLSIEKVIVAVIMTFVIINGEIDLSVASVMAFSACVLAAAYESGVPFGLAIVLALVAPAQRASCRAR